MAHPGAAISTCFQGPDFEVKKTLPCIACLLPCCVRCLQTIEIKKVDPTQGDSVIGSIKPTACCDILASICCYGRNHAMFTTKDVDNSDKFVLRCVSALHSFLLGRFC